MKPKVRYATLFHVGRRKDGEPAFIYCDACREFTEHGFDGERVITSDRSAIPIAWPQVYRCDDCGCRRVWGTNRQPNVFAAKAA